MSCSVFYTDAFTRDDLRLGMLGSAISLPVSYIAMETSVCLMKKWGLAAAESRAYFQFYETLSTVPHALLRGALKSLAVIYVVLLVPIVEEWFFRDFLYPNQQEAHEAFALRAFRVISNGVLFGAFHVSLFQGWTNIPIFIVITVAGIAFATLREVTGNTRASTVAHIMNNSFFMILKYVTP